MYSTGRSRRGRLQEPTLELRPDDPHRNGPDRQHRVAWRQQTCPRVCPIALSSMKSGRDWLVMRRECPASPTTSIALGCKEQFGETPSAVAIVCLHDRPRHDPLQIPPSPTIALVPFWLIRARRAWSIEAAFPVAGTGPVRHCSFTGKAPQHSGHPLVEAADSSSLLSENFGKRAETRGIVAIAHLLSGHGAPCQPRGSVA